MFLKDWVYFIEIMNEITIYLTGYFMFFFTEWISDFKVRYGFGSIFNDLLFIVIILNLLGVAVLTHSDLSKERRKQIYQERWKDHFEYKM